MRHRKSGKRHPCGKLIQPTAKERSEIAARKARTEMEFVESQPHRRGFSDPGNPWLASELGRFCRVHRLRREIYEAAGEWANIVRLYGAVWGAPQAENHGSGGMGQGPSMATQEKWKAQMLAIEEALYGDHGTNKARYKATSDLVLRGYPVPRELVPHALDGLRIVAIELNWMAARDQPFQEAA